MTRSIPEQLAAAQQSNVEASFLLVRQAFEGFEKLVALNLNFAGSTLAQMREFALQAPGTPASQQWLALQSAVSGPPTEQLLTYSRQLSDITTTTQSEIVRLAQTQYGLHNARVQALVESSAKSTPAGAEAAIAAWKSAIGSSATLWETLQKTGQQALRIAGDNLETVTAIAPRAVRRAPDQLASN